jgi:hypothetical protein
MPCFNAFFATVALPSRVFGPVDCRQAAADQGWWRAAFV